MNFIDVPQRDGCFLQKKGLISLISPAACVGVAPQSQGQSMKESIHRDLIAIVRVA